MSEQPVLVWHRDDLRPVDHPALAAAAEQGTPVPVFVFDPVFYTDRHPGADARIEFLFESLEELATWYQHREGELTYLCGDPVDRLEAVANELDTEVYYAQSPTAGYAHNRDHRAATTDRFVGISGDGIRRETETPRDGWQSHIEEYMDADPYDPPETVGTLPQGDDITVEEARDKWEISPEKWDVPSGGRTAAFQRLETFIDSIQSYPESISPPAAARKNCSRLSPYLAKGVLSIREVYQFVTNQAPTSRGRQLFTQRLFWNRHFTQKLEDFPKLPNQAVNPVFRGLHRKEHEPELVAAWKRGETGFPLVDASMRALRETGYLNFRMRALCASFFCHILREWWKRGADYLHGHLIDADTAINYAQWQMQGGLVGVHPLRIYDPAKNTREHDPDGEFIREFVPELQPVPTEYLPRPERMSTAVQSEVGVTLDEDYPRPIVDFEARRQQTRDQHAKLADRARETLSDPAIYRRASLSRRHETIKEESSTQGQTALTDFQS